MGIGIVDAAGTIEAVNFALLDLLGFEEHELVGQHISQILHRAPWSEQSGLSEWFALNRNKVIELEARGKDDQVCVVDFSIREYDADKQDRLVVVLQDVTERFLANQLRHDFYQMINHDIRSPLTNVVLFLKLMESRTECGTLTDFGRERLSAAQKNVERIIALADGLLELDKLESADNLAQETVDVKRLIKEAIVGVTEAAATKDIGLSSVIEEASVEGDHARLLQVLVNLLSNAIAHSQPGSAIQVQVKPQSSYLRFAVRDHGRGVPDEEKLAIFDRFRQGGRRTEGGHGLGLAICKQIINQHGGTIGVSNAPGGGSVFWFEIPTQGSNR